MAKYRKDFYEAIIQNLQEREMTQINNLIRMSEYGSGRGFHKYWNELTRLGKLVEEAQRRMGDLS